MLIHRNIGTELMVDDHVVWTSDRVNLDTDGPATWQGNGYTIIYSPYKYELIGPEKIWNDKKGTPFAGVMATRCNDIAVGKSTRAHMITLCLHLHGAFSITMMFVIMGYFFFKNTVLGKRVHAHHL